MYGFPSKTFACGRGVRYPLWCEMEKGIKRSPVLIHINQSMCVATPFDRLICRCIFNCSELENDQEITHTWENTAILDQFSIYRRNRIKPSINTNGNMWQTYWRIWMTTDNVYFECVSSHAAIYVSSPLLNEPDDSQTMRNYYTFVVLQFISTRMNQCSK